MKSSGLSLSKSTLTLFLVFMMQAGMPALQAKLFSGGKKARVVVDSVVLDELPAAKQDGSPVSYHFFKGRHYGGTIADRSLDRVSFQDLANTLGKDMLEQGFVSEPDPRKGDLFIVVHWGVTTVAEDFNELLGEDVEIDEDGFEVESDAGSRDVFSPQTQDSSAVLIGYDRALRGNISSQAEYELRMDLEEERYFIIMMAYDYQKLLAEKELKLLWSTRFSLRSIGTNFEDAYLALSRGASPYFGENLDGLERNTTYLGRGDIDFGELEVLEVNAEAKEE